MGVSLTYRSSDALASDVKASVKADADRVNGERRWWCEPLHFFDSTGHEGKLVGDTKLFLSGYTTDNGEYVEVDPADDCFMAARDARFILGQLARWSAEHGVTWCLEIEGGEVGTIVDGKVDAEQLNMINELLLLGSEDLDMATTGTGVSNIDDEERAKNIDHRYGSR